MKTIFIAAHYNMNNGDRAVLEATINKLYQYNDKTKIIVSVADSKTFIDSRFEVVKWPLKNNRIYKFIFLLLARTNNVKLMKLFYRLYVSNEYLEALRRSDIVLITGGHHLTDILGYRNFYNLAINFLIPLFENKEIFLMPQSIGPVNNLKMKNITKYILNHAKQIAYRDNSSRKFLDELNLKTKYEYVPDVVFSLPKFKESIKNNEIGIALYCSYVGEKKHTLMPWVIENLIEVINEYTRKGFKISIISMDPNDIEVGKKIVKECNNSNNVVKLESPETENILDIIKLFSNKELVLAYKTHSVIFSLINLTPVIAIAYHPKSIEFMESVNLKKYSVEDKNASKNKLCELIESALNNREEIIKKEKEGVKVNNEIIDGYLKKILKVN